jgi:uncharacterized protein DUF3800
VSAHELASIAFGRSRRGILVPLRVYFDGSGHEGSSSVITVGGFMAESSICEEIEQDWEKVTGGRLFHLKDFGTNHCKLGSRSWTKEEQSTFLKRLAGIVNRSGVYIISASLEVDAFNKTLSDAIHPGEIGPAFSGCAYAAFAFVENVLMREKRERQKVNYVFEKGDREHEISNTFRDLDDRTSTLRNLRGHSFEPKATTLLQAADLVAGIIERCLVNAHSALPNLENGLSRTPLNNFEHYYSDDGVTAAVVSGHDSEHCWVANPPMFQQIDKTAKEFLDKRPAYAKKRAKRTTFTPKKARR